MKALKISTYTYNILFLLAVLFTHFVFLVGTKGNTEIPFVHSVFNLSLNLLILELFLVVPLVFVAAALIDVLLIVGSDFIGAMEFRDTVINLCIFGVTVVSYIIRLFAMYGGTWFSGI